jgi:hypothetical protein
MLVEEHQRQLSGIQRIDELRESCQTGVSLERPTRVTLLERVSLAKSATSQSLNVENDRSKIGSVRFKHGHTTMVVAA